MLTRLLLGKPPDKVPVVFVSLSLDLCQKKTMQKMSKEEFIEILSRQQRSGLTIKDFCINEAYTESSFYYWKGKFGLSRRYHMDRHSSSLEEFAPVSLTSSPASHSACDSGAIQTGEIRIEFPGGIIAHFSGMAESQAAMQLLTQLCNRHVLPE
ncbi:IS66 family insertion sequence element accessory protein TnpB [Bacteroides thetaiotaomicron]|nr:IS66 family insertion sequence element accessory protein TnpB [Bacteroides thetaiotaomicron]